MISFNVLKYLLCLVQCLRGNEHLISTVSSETRVFLSAVERLVNTRSSLEVMAVFVRLVRLTNEGCHNERI